MGQNAPYLCIAKRVTGHGVYSTVHRPLYREAFSCRKHENPEAASAIWGRMLHICASRSVLLDTECTVTPFRQAEPLRTQPLKIASRWAGCLPALLLHTVSAVNAQTCLNCYIFHSEAASLSVGLPFLSSLS